jgi:hypothetical protein
MGFLDTIRRGLAGGDDELGRDDLLRAAEDGILALKRHGARGREVFPAGVRIVVRAAEGSLATLGGFVKDPSFERDLEARLVNRLVDAEALPARRYVVERGEVAGITVEEDDRAVAGILVIEGGDQDGSRFPVDLGRKEWRVGRGRWHQERPDDQRLPNDIVLTETLSWVSRAAAIVRRSGALLEIEARQQGEYLIVVRRDGTQVRPAMTASGRTPLRVGDRVELHDGQTGRIAIRFDPAEDPC